MVACTALESQDLLGLGYAFEPDALLRLLPRGCPGLMPFILDGNDVRPYHDAGTGFPGPSEASRCAITYLPRLPQPCPHMGKTIPLSEGTLRAAYTRCSKEGGS